MKRTARYGTVLYLIALVAIWGCVYFDSGELWPVTLFLLGPRWIVALPLVVLIPLTLFADFRLSVVYVLHAAVIVFPLLGYQVPWQQATNAEGPARLRILTCNLGGGTVDTGQLVAIAKSEKIDVILLQECSETVSQPVFRELGWSHLQEANMAIGSAFPLSDLQVLARQSAEQYKAVAAISCDVQVATASSSSASQWKNVKLVNVHLPTFRPALEQLLGSRADVEPELRRIGAVYHKLSANVRDILDGGMQPTIIAGDFNVPVDSVYYRDHWDVFQNAFSKVGQGFGYTKFTRYHGVRIDHVLADHHWTVRFATVRSGFGGDHRPVLVELDFGG